MLELLDRIKERNFGKTIELRGYTGFNAYDYKLIAAGIGVYSLFVNGQDFNVTLYDFNLNRTPEKDKFNEIDVLITDMIRAKYN